jgi:hypothetical protein
MTECKVEVKFTSSAWIQVTKVHRMNVAMHSICQVQSGQRDVYHITKAGADLQRESTDLL